ncbi:MAG: cytochrome c family protein [Candidatus Marinimicrobia bacterium]|nr:cytochrome c family protein [Candidatus Neomarinimicrobiota bacterium]
MHSKLYIAILVGFISVGLSSAQPIEYVGSQKCKSCHKSEKKGAQYKLWEESKHAKAFDVLLSEAALKIAAERKLKLPPSESPECLECHTVGFGKGGYEVMDAAFWNAPKEDKKARKAIKRMEGLKNVGCEVCHGPGDAYKKKKVMQGIYSDSLKASDYSLVTIPSEETCLKCHNERSPSFKPFNYEERVKEIAHPFPKDM